MNTRFVFTFEAIGTQWEIDTREPLGRRLQHIEIDYETTQKVEPFKGTVVSRKSVADLVVELAESPELEVRRSLGVNKPLRRR